MSFSCSKNTPPVIVSLYAEPDSIYIGETTNLLFTYDDPDKKDALIVLWNCSYGKLLISGNPTKENPTKWIAPKVPGVYFINLQIKDLADERDADSVKITVLDSTGTFTDARDGHKYKWIKIGSQVWMAENLAYLPNVTAASTQGSFDSYFVYDYEGNRVSDAKRSYNYNTYGVLYNSPSKACPAGWHLPLKVEWVKLVNYLGNDAAMKLKSTTRWSSDSLGNNRNGNNLSGFNALPGGYRDFAIYHGGPGSHGYCASMGDGAWFWEAEASAFNLSVSSYRLDWGRSDFTAFSVRCVKDE